MKLKQLTALYSNPTSPGVPAALSAFSIALLVNALILIIPPPFPLTRTLFNFRLDVAFLLVIVLGLVFSRKGIAWDTASLTLTLVLFSIPLIYKWQTARYDGYLLGGLLPWSDAHAYYSGAHHLMSEGSLTLWATRRPLFAGLLSVLLSITGGNLQVSLAILAVINGLAVFLASREIQKIFGPFTAATFLAICYWYYCAHAGITASEQLGLCFGSLGTAFLIRGAQQKESLRWAAYGLFLLTLALNARAGAFFILPILALWFGINYRKGSSWQKPILVGIAVIIVGMTANLSMVKMIGPAHTVPFSNYAYTLYGLASGNQGWSQVIRDYPEVKEEEVFGLAIQKIKENPSLFLIGTLRSYQDYFTKERGPFSFLGLVNDRKKMGNQLLWILTWAGLASSLLKHKQGQHGLILAAFVGILLSVSLVPPIDSNAMRIYAATIPFAAYIASAGIAVLEQPLQKIGLSAGVSAGEWSSPNLLLPFSAMLMVICFAGPLLVKISSRPQEAGASFFCPPGEEEMIFLMDNGSSVKLVDDQTIRESYLPSIRITDFRKSVELEPTLYPFLTQELTSLKPGNIISIGTYRRTDSTDLNFMQGGYLITKGDLLKPGLHQICAAPSNDTQLRDAFFYDKAESKEMEQLNPSVLHKNPALVKMVRILYGIGILWTGVFAALSAFGFWSLPPIKRLLLFGGVALIFAGILVHLHSNAIYSLAWEREPLKMKDAIHRGGYSYKVPLGIDWMDRKDLGGSPAIVYEDGIPLKFPNATPFAIRNRGEGRFSVERGNLFLSSSDNSDPRSNGRHYEIYWPTPILPPVRWVSYALTIISAVLLLLHLRKTNSQIEEPAKR